MPLIDVIQALWRKKWLLLAVSGGISLAFGLLLYQLPRAYHAQFMYAYRMDAPTLQKLVDRFYSGENKARLLEAFNQAKLEKAQAKFAQIEERADMKKFLSLYATPNYIDYSQKRNMKLSFERTWAENIEKLEQLTAEFLALEITGIPKSELKLGIPLLRHNLERQLPLYDLQDQWISSRMNTQTALAQRDARKRTLELDLQKLANTLVQLKAVDEVQDSRSNYQLQINIDSKDGKNGFLPLDLRIQGYESELAQLREQLADDQRRYQLELVYDQLLITMLKQVHDQLENNGDILQLKESLIQFRNNQTTSEAKEFLASHIRMIEHNSLTRKPLTETASIMPIAKGTVSKTAFLFVIIFMVGVLMVALEDLSRHHRKNTA